MAKDFKVLRPPTQLTCLAIDHPKRHQVNRVRQKKDRDHRHWQVALENVANGHHRPQELAQETKQQDVQLNRQAEFWFGNPQEPESFVVKKNHRDAGDDVVATGKFQQQVHP